MTCGVRASSPFFCRWKYFCLRIRECLFVCLFFSLWDLFLLLQNYLTLLCWKSCRRKVHVSSCNHAPLYKFTSLTQRETVHSIIVYWCMLSCGKTFVNHQRAQKLNHFLKHCTNIQALIGPTFTKSLQVQGSFIGLTPLNVQSILRIRETAHRTHGKRAQCK